jgi:hypothetical protein
LMDEDEDSAPFEEDNCLQLALDIAEREARSARSGDVVATEGE